MEGALRGSNAIVSNCLFIMYTLNKSANNFSRHLGNGWKQRSLDEPRVVGGIANVNRLTNS
ncbi:unnamed protein product [Haemonchus placei]|uniref:Fork-head domain-containing protein n=1 Tax=Haemonchus placei TaxID=6290 RepID=A0A0N4W3Q8_HAEPC|nr:unnamed protein product [Haemonchus placei]